MNGVYDSEENKKIIRLEDESIVDNKNNITLDKFLSVNNKDSSDNLKLGYFEVVEQKFTLQKKIEANLIELEELKESLVISIKEKDNIKDSLLMTMKEKDNIKDSLLMTMKEKDNIKDALLMTMKEKDNLNDCLFKIINEKEEIEKSYNKTKELVNLFIDKVEKNNVVFIPQIIGYSEKINEIINGSSFIRFIKIHAVLVHWKNTKLSGKIKLLIKLLLRPFGFKKNLYYEYESNYYRLSTNATNILNAASMMKCNIFENEEKVISNKSNNDEITFNKKDNETMLTECWYSEEPLISILLPVYNHARFICDAIEGVQRQKYTNWELIIINDGSTDDLLDRIMKYSGNSRIKIYSQDNQRLPNTLTNLHQLASGQFITWTSADNIMEPDMLSVLSSHLLKNPDAAMVYADVAIIDNKGLFVNSGYREFNKDKIYPYIMRLPHSTDTLKEECDNFINACFMYRSEISNAINGQYAADLEGLEDYDFWLRLQAFGNILHINNTKPLYCYRVHENTMSEDLLKNKRDQHIKRSNKLMQFSQKRSEFCKLNWKINYIDENENKFSIYNILNEINYNYNNKSNKNINLYLRKENQSYIGNSLNVIENQYFYEIVYVNKELKAQKRIEIHKGIEIPKLAKKVRQTNIGGLYWEYPAKFVNKHVVGCHIDYNYIDIQKTILFIKNNSDILFSFCPVINGKNSTVKKKITEECNNVIFLDEKELGTPIYLYASWDMMFIPPLLNSEHDIMPLIVLSWNIGKWILIELDNIMSDTLPLTAVYFYNEKLMGIKVINNIGTVESVLDSYILRYSNCGVINYLLQCCNGIGQDIFVPRPDFEMDFKERKFPPNLLFQGYDEILTLQNEYIAVMVDTLDKGGLEQVVALIVRELILRNINIKVFCTEKGGVIADELKNEGVEIIIFNNDRDKFINLISENPPKLVNTHYTKKMLEIVYSKNIPIVEVIHNMYVFFNDNDWINEKQRVKYFNKMIAVSELVKETYVNKNVDVDDNKIVVIGNAANSDKIYGSNRLYCREMLNIPSNSVVFINISSIDGRKNQIGLLSAFEVYFNTIDESAYLIIAGNILSEYYDNEIESYMSQLSCKNNIIKLNYHNRVADLYHASDIFIMPSYFEGWSIAATEALYCGLPIIHSRCGSAIELVDSEKNGLIISNPAGDISNIKLDSLIEKMGYRIPANTDELVNAMKTMSAECDKWRNNKYLNSTNALNKFSVKNMIESYIKCFKNTLK